MRPYPGSILTFAKIPTRWSPRTISTAQEGHCEQPLILDVPA